MAKPRSAAQSPQVSKRGQLVSAQERQRLIAEAAYYRAVNRGFDGGDPVDDWLAAEREINRLLPSAKEQKEEALIYEKLRAKVTKLLADAQDAVNADTVRQALDKATEEMKKTGAHTTEAIGKIATSLRKDMINAAAAMGPRWEAFSEKSADLFGVWRDRSTVFLLQAADAVAEWLQETSSRLARPTYRAGEMVAPGTFECTLCGERLTLSTAAHLPACSKCGKLEYRRI
jgi:Zinc-ribbon containing domain/Protein of unknown function (DUF2934)